MTVESPPRGYRVSADPGVRVVVWHLALACCSLEVEAAISGGLLVQESGTDPVEHTVLLVAGTVTDALAPAILRARARLDGPVSVLAFGACASTGGPYWDAPTVTKGVDQLLEVRAYVPGCPPRPEALVAALAGVAGRRSPAGRSGP